MQIEHAAQPLGRRRGHHQQHPALRQPRPQLAPDGDLLALPGVHVDHGHVGPARHGTRHHVTVAVGLGDDLDVVLTGQQSSERSPHQAGVLDEKNADHCRSHSAVAAR
ncbi:hypothetical protein [Streptomyces afghaniensis]|uniref:hypothetical protein n=1 Tax=Streptomyces afghaniensis TaxID=66865 RepID=UPI002468F3E9|nr:hypothetical protein [Streptomyces afghaniensis]